MLKVGAAEMCSIWCGVSLNIICYCDTDRDDVSVVSFAVLFNYCTLRSVLAYFLI